MNSNLCPNCQTPGHHFVPPSMGEEGFYVCDEKQEMVEVPAKFLDKTSETIEGLVARISELEAESKRLLAFVNTEVLEVSQSEKILVMELENQRLRDLVGKAFDAGARWNHYDEALEWRAGWDIPQHKTQFLHANGLGE